MHLPKRFWLISGFTVSAVSVIVNAVVIANFNDDKNDLLRDHSFAKDRLFELSSSLYQAEAKFDTYKVLHHLAYVNMPAERASDARDDAMYMLQGYLAKAYAAANDVTPIDLYETQTIELGSELDALLRIRNIANKLQSETDPRKRAALNKELDAINDDGPAKTELGRKLKAVGETSKIEQSTDAWVDWELAFLPTTKAFREKTIVTIKGQKEKVRRLEKEIADLDARSDLANYLAIALQMIGLMLVLAESAKGKSDTEEPEAERAADE